MNEIFFPDTPLSFSLSQVANGIEYNKKDFTLTLSLSRTSCAVAHMLVKFLPVTMIANVASQLFLRSSWLLSNNIKITSYNLNSLSVSLMDLVDLNLFWIGGISGAATRKIKFGGRFIVKLTFAHQLLDSNQSSSPSSSIPLYLNKLEEIAQIELNKDRDLIHLLDVRCGFHIQLYSYLSRSSFPFFLPSSG